jgi:hypothetical protein
MGDGNEDNANEDNGATDATDQDNGDMPEPLDQDRDAGRIGGMPPPRNEDGDDRPGQ